MALACLTPNTQTLFREGGGEGVYVIDVLHVIGKLEKCPKHFGHHCRLKYDRCLLIAYCYNCRFGTVKAKLIFVGW